MDHHCPWTVNCVSHRTLAHFLRFLVYAVLSMIYLESFLFDRITIVWHKRHSPSVGQADPFPEVSSPYSTLGPHWDNYFAYFFFSSSTPLHCLLLASPCSEPFGRSGTMSQQSKAGRSTDTRRFYDVQKRWGVIWTARTAKGSGSKSRNFRTTSASIRTLCRLLAGIHCLGCGHCRSPCQTIAASILKSTALKVRHDDREDPLLAKVILDPSTTWPPPDPDRIARKRPWAVSMEHLSLSGENDTNSERVKNFKARQAKDLYRFDDSLPMQRRRAFHDRYSQEGIMQVEKSHTRDPSKGEEAWKNSEGESLGDFGVDEAAEFYDEDEVPLATLIRQKRLTKRTD